MKVSFRLFDLSTWSRIGKNPATTFKEELDNRPNVLLSQFCVFGCLGSISVFILDLFNGSNYALIIDSFLVALMVSIYLLNEYGYHKLARYSFILSINLILFVYANLVPKEVGIYLVFFPLVGGSYIFLSRSGKFEKFALASLPIVILFVLEIGNYQLFGDINIEEGNPKDSLYVNLAIATIAFSIAVNHLVKLNQKNEESILQNRNKFKSLAEEIDEKNKTLKKANAELDRFVYSTSHDLRAPLMSILGLIELVKEESDPSLKSNYLQLMEDRIQKLDIFIKDIIEYSRNSRADIFREEINLKELVNGVISNYQYQENASKVKFKVNIGDHEVIQSDKQRLGMILNNLVGNAIKYHNYSVGNPEINLQSKRQTGNILISVADNGPGIQESEQAKIFDMFYRGSHKSDGSGLGLYIAREISSKLNGDIMLNSTPGKGSEFTVVLPEN